MSFAVCVTFKITPDYWTEFLGAIQQNAATSKTVEENCLQFDVCTDEDYPYEVFLYEIYTSAEAFDFHLKSPHFITFDAKVAEMIEAKQVRTYRTVD